MDQNEATTEGIIEIMREQHNFVPGHDTKHPLRMLSFGDLLTVERQQNAQDDLRDSLTPSNRLEGLIPALADFHSYGNFLEVIKLNIDCFTDLLVAKIFSTLSDTKGSGDFS